MIAAITPENTLLSQTNACGSAPSPLDYSLREAYFPELNAQLRSEGFEPSGKGLAAWARLARIVPVDAVIVTVGGDRYTGPLPLELAPCRTPKTQRREREERHRTRCQVESGQVVR